LESNGPDCIQNFWIKHVQLCTTHIQTMISGEIPDWLTLRRTVSLLKSKEVGAELVTNCRPIMYLSGLWRLITLLLFLEILHHFDSKKVWPWEQKGCKRKSRGTKDHLFVDKLVIVLTKQRH